MVALEKKYQILELILCNRKITMKTLKQIGLSGNDVHCLIKYNFLCSTEKGFDLADYNELVNYSRYLLEHNEQEKAKKCLELAFKKDSSNQNALIKLFINALKNKDTHNMLLYFDSIYENGKYGTHHKEHILYLLILSDIVDLPEKYQDILKKLKLEDVLVTPSEFRGVDIDKENEIRSLLFEGKIKNALIMLQGNELGYINLINYYLLKQLCALNLSYKVDKAKEYGYYIEKGMYDNALIYLEALNENDSLYGIESCILLLVNIIINLSKGIKFETKKTETNNLFEAIYNYDFERALALIDKKHTRYEYQLLKVLLIRINSYDIKTKQDSDIDKEDSLEEVISILPTMDLYKINEVMKRYLPGLSNDEYKIIECSLYLDVLLRNREYNFTKNIIGLLKDKNIKEIIRIFSCELVCTEMDSAHTLEVGLYYEILFRCVEINKSSIDLHGINDYLKKGFTNMGYPENIAASDIMRSHIAESLNKGIDIEFLLPQIKSYTAKEIDDIFTRLRVGGGIHVFENIDSNTEELLLDYVSSKDDLKIMISCKPKLLVVKYQLKKETYKNYSIDIADAEEAFNRGKFSLALDIYLELLTSFDNPDAFIFTKIAECYINLGSIKDAIPYLKVANRLNEFEYNSKDDSVRIKDFEYQIYMDQKKERENLNKYLELIKTLTELAHKIFTLQLNLSEEILKNNLDKDSINILKLILVRIYLKNNLANAAIRLYDEVISEDEKSTYVMYLIKSFDSEISGAKKFIIRPTNN